MLKYKIAENILKITEKPHYQLIAIIINRVIENTLYSIFRENLFSENI